jgi:16S rRNA (adenine1518-N6/adenine1519-N6)-dimethyltransferase
VRRVVAVEIDEVLAHALPTTVAARSPHADRLEVVTQDALTLTDVPRPRRRPRSSPTCPYNVAVPVLLRLLEHLPSLRTGLVMVQAEVADRLARPPAAQDLRRAVGQGRLVRGGAARRCDRPERLLAGPARRRGWSPSPAASRRRTARGLRRRRRSVRPQRRKTLRARLPAGPARRPPPRSGCARRHRSGAAARSCVDDFARLPHSRS